MCESSSIIYSQDSDRQPNSLILRQASMEENEQIQDVILSSFFEYSALLPEEGWNDYKSNIIEAVNTSLIAHRIVAEYEGQIVGSLFLYRSGLDAYGSDELQINDPVVRLLAVAPKARGLGVGKKLISYSIELAKTRGAKAVYLHTSDMMNRAVAIYEQLGFERAYEKEYEKGTIFVKSYKYIL